MVTRRHVFHFIAILIAFFLEVTVIQILFSPAVSLRLLFLIGLVLLFLDYSEEAFWWLVFGGVLLDLQSSQVFGLQTLIFLGIYLGVNFFRQRIVHQPNLFLLAAIVIVSILINDLADWLMLAGRGSWLNFLRVFGWNILINLLFVWPIYIAVFYLSEWLKRYNFFINREKIDVKKTL